MCATYNHTGLGGVLRGVSSPREAAETLARREYGKRGVCVTLRTDSWSEDGRRVVYEAFIGRPVRGSCGSVAGRNVWLYATSQEG